MQLCHSSCRRSCVLLDRLMWMCHTGRAAAALTQKPHRAAIRTARERERGTCATLPGTQITAYSSISNIKTEMGKKGITEKSPLGFWLDWHGCQKAKERKRHGTVSKSLGNHFGGDSSFDQIKRINSFSSSSCISSSSSSFPLHVYRKEEKSRADCFKVSRNSIIVPTLSPSSQLSTIVYRGASKWTEVVYGCISHLGHTSMATEFPPKEKQRITPHSTPPSPE